MKNSLTFNNYQFCDLFKAEKLAQLDAEFLDYLKNANALLHEDLLTYRDPTNTLTPEQISEIIIAGAKVLEDFLGDFFNIEDALEKIQTQTLKYRPIFAFKKWYVLRRAKRRLSREEDLPSFKKLDDWLKQQLKTSDNSEQAIAAYALPLLEDKEKNADEIEKITQWCIQAVKTKEGRHTVQNWMSFKLPKHTDYKRLIPIIPIKHDKLEKETLPENELRQRDGFKLTDERMNIEEVLSEADYCVYCHENDGDFCSKGFPEKKSDPSQGLRKNPLNNTLTGCPLDEKISEMNLLKRDGHTIAALATIMIDNPMCPATGHRICNDCMKACIYQKQDPVDIPQIETRALTDVLDLPWGIEIYDLLTRWNPLRKKQWVEKPYNGLKVFIAGMGPAGFTLAHHLLMEGFAVVGTDGLKIEPLPKELIDAPIKDFSSIKESLDERKISGFGGVAEYGITVRWDKNFLKLIYISLMRRSHFQVFGGVRFGGTVTTDDLWELGFDHGVIAVGAGLPKALPIPGSLARGMRQANDFLMALQLTGAAKKESLANLQIRLPVVIIGSGLTGVDAATEAQAYYIAQVEKALHRYEKLCAKQSEKLVRENFDKESLTILDEFLNHAKQIRKERERAEKNNEQPDFIKLIRSWGGVSITYRRHTKDSPAYRENHEELHKALEEGIYYQECLQPVEAILDEHHHIKTLICQRREQDENGAWHDVDGTLALPARTVLTATGAQPNIAYSFEHPGVFHRNGLEYQPYENINGKLTIVEKARHLKTPDFGPFTSYDKDGHRISFVGDTHPTFHGNVVSAIASALRCYPKIVNLFGKQAEQTADEASYETFANAMRGQFQTHIKSVTRRANNIVELEVHAPMSAKRFSPGEFLRLQNYETHAIKVDGTILQSEPMALAGFGVDRTKGSLKLMVIEKGSSSKVFSTLKPNDPIAIMGPTGVRSKIPEDKETILIIGDSQQSLAYVRAVGPALKAKGNPVLYFANFNTADELFCQSEIENCTDQVFWSTQDGSTIKTNRPQDQFKQDSAINTLIHFSQSEQNINIDTIDRVTVIGNTQLLRDFQEARYGVLQNKLRADIKVFGAIYTTMQCMLKGVCAQCLQWQIDPETGLRTKAVFSCSWQDQPLDLVDLDNFDERLGLNRMAETLSDLWLEHLFETHSIDRV